MYYQFDEEEFRKYHYQKGYFDFRRDGFGPVCTTQEALLEALTESFENGMEMRTEYAQRTERFSRCMTEITAGGRLKRL